jgi:DNA-binding protein
MVKTDLTPLILKSSRQSVALDFQPPSQELAFLRCGPRATSWVVTTPLRVAREGLYALSRIKSIQPNKRRHKTMAEKTERNSVFIGIKPVMNYVLAVITQFNMGTGDVILKARGKAISRAVDVAEIVRNRFLQSLKVKSISIGTEELQIEGGTINVSSIEITLVKGE